MGFVIIEESRRSPRSLMVQAIVHLRYCLELMFSGECAFLPCYRLVRSRSISSNGSSIKRSGYRNVYCKSGLLDGINAY